MQSYLSDSFNAFASGLVVAVTTYNRQAITQLCVTQLALHSTPAQLWIIDDYSTDYCVAWLQQLAPQAKVFQPPYKMGIEQLRVYIHQLAVQQDITHIYHTDNDAYHDPTWLYQLFRLQQHAIQLQAMYAPKMLSLYNAKLHEPYTTAQTTDCWIRTTCQGLSMCYRVQDMPIIDANASFQNWDVYFGGLLRPTLVSKVSYMEHLGGDGLHSAKQDFYTDTAVNPTAWLAVERSRLLQSLGMSECNPKPDKFKVKISFNKG